MELAFDETLDNNLRYIGANPNNYVSFNNELWRIIGAMNNIDDGTGKKETRLKIIRNEPIGKYSWDNKASGVGSSTSSLGSNDWSDSALQIILNEGAYWNRTSGECPYGSNGLTTPCDFSSNGLTNDAKQMITNAKWHLGGAMNYTTSVDGLVSNWYIYERETTVYGGHEIEWIGKIGLMYPSDYGYATSGGTTTNRESCLKKELYNWSDLDINDCKTNNWIYKNTIWQWMLTPGANGGNLISHTGIPGYVRYDYANDNGYSVNPVVYLKSNIKIINGNGTENDPYILSL